MTAVVFQAGQSRGHRTNSSIAAALRICEFRTIINHTPRLGILGSDIGITLVVLDGEPTPFCETIQEQVLACFRSGRAILLAANRPDLRDFAKRQLIELLMGTAADPVTQFVCPIPTLRRS